MWFFCFLCLVDTNFGLDQSEIARQNQITQQLLASYLEKRLGIGAGVTQKVPTIAEILPKVIVTTTSTTTQKPRYTKSLRRPKPRGFAVSSSALKRGSSSSSQRKTYGNSSSSLRKTPNSLQELLKYRRKQTEVQKQQEQEPEDDYDEEVEEPESVIDDEEEQEPESDAEAEIDYDSQETEAEAEDDDFSNNKTLVKNNSRRKQHQPELDEDGEEYLRSSSKSRYRPDHGSSKRYRHHQTSHRHYDEDIDQDGQEALQSVESEQHDHYYKSKSDLFARDPSENEIDSGKSKLTKNRQNNKF